MEKHLKKKSIEEQGRKQPETLQSWKPNEQQMQVYQPRMKSAEEIFPESLLNYEAKDEL